MGNIDFRAHFFSLAVLAVSLIYLSITLYIRIANETELVELRGAVVQQRLTNNTSFTELSVLNANAPDYELYREQGVIGEANKLNWIEHLDSVSKEIGIPSIQFTIENTRKVQEGETPFYHYEIPIYVTEMYLDLLLLHEGDLYLLLNEMASRANGLFSVEACELQRIGAKTSKALFEGLKGKCHLRWFNLEDITLAWQDVEASYVP
ncbi:hypothetical protein [Saccharophagus degradans]|uniref:hypothetical protein n=1 Tax=Saccharophagus degradans TaxID=86304 RepID=UPI000039110E|nr:hypothetical protein [Saccharophagus degradans]